MSLLYLGNIIHENISCKIEEDTIIMQKAEGIILTFCG